MKNLYILLPLLITFSLASAQFPMKKLSRAVTNNTEDEIAPFLSMDGTTLLYSRKRAMDEDWKVQISKKVNGTWQRPQELKILNALPKLRLLGSYAINNEANEILFVSKRRGGLGSYDLWFTKLKGNNWSEPTNLAKPINSKLEEINPIFSTNGKTIYFVQRVPGQDNGYVMKSNKKGNYYSTPIKVDFGGQFFCPRLAPDNKTMYLSKIVNNETELYISRKADGKWTKAIKVNGYTKTNDKYFTLSSKSTNLLVSAKKDNTYDLFLKKLSDEYKSVPVTKLDYNVSVPFKCEITEGTPASFKKTPTSGTYLANDQNYIIKIKTKDHFNSLNLLELKDAKSKKLTLSPDLIKKTNTAELPLFVEKSDELETEKLTLELIAISSSVGTGSHELVIFQNNISTDTIQSEEFNKDISYDKESEITEDQETVSTTIEKTHYPLFSNDKTELWKKHVEDILNSNNIKNLTVKVVDDTKNKNIPNSGLYVRPIN